MKQCLLLPLSILGRVPEAFGWHHSSADVFEETFQSKARGAMVAFVLPQEAKSKALEPEWVSAAPYAEVPMISIDCDVEKALCEAEGVKEFPSVRLYSVKDKELLFDYPHPRRASAMLRFIDRHLRGGVADLDFEKYQGFKGADEVAFIAYLAADDTQSKQRFASVAKEFLSEFSFGIVSDPAAGKEENVELPGLVCYITSDDERRTFKGSFADEKDIRNFIIDASRSVFTELMPYNHQRLLERGGGWPMVYLFAETAEQRVELRQALRKFAKSYYDSLTSVIVDPADFPGLMEKLGLDPTVLPAGALHRLSTNHIYPYPKGRPLTSKSIQNWGLDIYQGKVKPWTPPGATTSHEDAGDAKVAKVTASRKVSIETFPGMKIRVAGHDEL